MQQNTALLVMDMQTAILGMLPSSEAFITNTASAIAKARENNVPVIYVVVGFRQGTPESALTIRVSRQARSALHRPICRSLSKYTRRLHPARTR
jgi:nicotinamidase-related amidase